MTTPRRGTAIAPLPALPALLLLAGSLAAHAAAPPDHPSPAEAYRMMEPGVHARSAAPAYEGEVVTAIDANEYTYIEVREQDGTRWIAGPRTALARGDIIRFDDGVVMKGFYSKRLDRSFPAVMFVSGVFVTPAGH